MNILSRTRDDGAIEEHEVDWDRPSYERRRGALTPEPVGQVGVPHERTPPSPLVWTRESPSTHGWYWNRAPGHEPVPLLVFDEGGYLYALGPGGHHNRDVRTFWRDEWSNQPLPLPCDP